MFLYKRELNVTKELILSRISENGYFMTPDENELIMCHELVLEGLIRPASKEEIPINTSYSFVGVNNG